MNDVQRLQTELQGHNATILEIEKRYPDGIITKDEDFDALQVEVKAVEQKSIDYANLRERQEALKKAADAARAMGAQNVNLPSVNPDGDPTPQFQMEHKSFGELFIESGDFAARLKGGAFDGTSIQNFKFELGKSLLENAREMKGLEQKTAGALIHGGRSGFDDAADQPFSSVARRAGYVPLLYAERTFSELFRRTPITEEIYEFVKEKTFTNNADTIAEASSLSGTSGTKPVSDFDFEVTNVVVKDIAHYMVVTNRMLRQSNLRSLIDERLALGLDIKVESQVQSGDGTGNNLTGILADLGIQTRAMGADNIFNAIHKALTAVRVTALSVPNFVAMNPEDWEIVRLTRELESGGGGYLFGPPSSSGVMSLWGIPVTLAYGLTKGTALVGDSNQAEILDRQRTAITVGTINDYFIRNTQVILAEMALAFAIYRPAAFCIVSGLAADK